MVCVFKSLRHSIIHSSRLFDRRVQLVDYISPPSQSVADSMTKEKGTKEYSNGGAMTYG